MTGQPKNPLIVQGDRTVLLEVDNPLYTEARDALARFAELEKSPEHIHTYRISPLSLWNAAASGMSADEITAALERYSKFRVPSNITREVSEYISRYGLVKLVRENDELLLVSDDPATIALIWRSHAAKPFLIRAVNGRSLVVKPRFRGHIKQALLRIGLPVEDLAGYITGAPLDINLAEVMGNGAPFVVRHYQRDSSEVFHAGGSARGGSGVIVLPCGAGKTIVGLAIMALCKAETLILVTSITAVNQWYREILDKTLLTEDDIGVYTAQEKNDRPITITTYQMLTYRKRKTSQFPHFELFNRRFWGLIIYDEVHLLPAPVFRITAEIQACRRLGLTATLVREDHKEDEVFSLIGPKRYDVPWKVLEKQGWIASAECIEIRIPLPPETRMDYALADGRAKFRIASENFLKREIVERLLRHHSDELVLIIGQYIKQLKALSKDLDIPLITGVTGNATREKLYGEFRRGEIRRLIVSKVGNFAIDLPDANVAIQVSGTFGSRQEEAQRLGRILRPKRDKSTAHFYSLVTRDSVEQDFAANRQLFLTEQGYSYIIKDAGEV